MSLASAGFAVGFLPLSGVFAVLLGGLLPLKVKLRRPFLILPGVLVGFAGFGSFLLGGSSAAYPALMLVGVASWAYIPVLFTIPMELPNMDAGSVAAVWATILTLGGVLSFLAPMVVGALTDATGSYLPGFSIFAVLSWSLALAGFLLPETGGKQPQPVTKE